MKRIRGACRWKTKKKNIMGGFRNRQEETQPGNAYWSMARIFANEKWGGRGEGERIFERGCCFQPLKGGKNFRAGGGTNLSAQ